MRKSMNICGNNDIHGIPPLGDCKENYEEFLCHSSVNNVINAIISLEKFSKLMEKKMENGW